MNIRPRNIPIFQNGGGVPQWYLDRYGNRTALLGWDLNKRYNYANQNLNANDHRNAGNLDTVYRKNMAYTGTPGAISSDIQTFYNSDGKGMSAEDFVKFYNSNAAKIRSHWAQDQTYNARTAGEHNKLFKKMFASRSNQSESPGSDYNIGYQNDLEDVEGSSTWLRRMDQYEKEYDPNNPDSNRLHEITLSDGTKATVYKKANGDIGLVEKPTSSESKQENTPDNQNQNQNDDSSTKVPTGHNDKYGFDWSKIKEGTQKIFGSPDLYAFGRLAGNLINNDRVYEEQLKGIKPVLKQSYHTHRQVVGDEATKQAYYRRAAAGQTRAAQPFTADADRQVAYMNEAKRIGDELRAQGDLADNAEIRRTSDESNQHQWANTQRDTEVANYNTASINQANALRHNLLAQKHSAQWSSIDNFLQGIEYRKRQKQAEQQALDDQIFALQEKSDLANDKEYIDAYNKYSKIIDANTDKTTGTITWNDTTLAAKREFEKAQTEAMVRSYQRRKQYYQNRGTIFAKSGTKITHKKKDDLLYKSTRDVVEHFRKMSKISSDAQDRKQPKIEKLAPHPKGKTRRYQQGGVAPFTVYKPVALGGETTTSSEISTSSTKSKKDSDELDLMKDLFKNLAVEGLPSDVNGIYYSMNNLLQKQKAFGNELTSDDIASMYLQQMQKINTIKFNKAQFDKAMQTATSNDALSEYAVNELGQIAAQNRATGKVTFMRWEDLKNKLQEYNPLTNGDLLNLRAYSPDQAFNYKVLEVVNNNGIGMSKIAQFLKAQLPSIGQSESTIEGYTKQDSNIIRAGIQLLKDAPAGDYKFSQYTKEQQKQAQMALQYLASILPRNMKTVLQVNADIQGISVANILQTLVGSTLDETSRLEFDAVTGKASKDSNGKSKDNGGGDMTPSMAFFMGMGDRNTFVIQDKTKDGLKVNTNSMSLLDSQGHNLGPSTLLGISQSMYGSQLDLNSATMGDVKISPNGQNNVLVSDGMIYSTELPIDKQAAAQGIIKPDLSFLKNIEKADQQLRAMGITSRDNLTPEQINTINKVYRDNNLPIIYTQDGNGKPVLTSEYRRFAMLNGYATEDAFEGDITFNDGALEVDDDKELKQFEGMMQAVTKNEKYKLDRGWFSGTDLYKGVIYIPMNSSTITALGGTGYKGTVNEYMNIDKLQQERDNALRLGYTNPGGNASMLK